MSGMASPVNWNTRSLTSIRRSNRWAEPQRSTTCYLPALRLRSRVLSPLISEADHGRDGGRHPDPRRRRGRAGRDYVPGRPHAREAEADQVGRVPAAGGAEGGEVAEDQRGWECGDGRCPQARAGDGWRGRAGMSRGISGILAHPLARGHRAINERVGTSLSVLSAGFGTGLVFADATTIYQPHAK